MNGSLLTRCTSLICTAWLLFYLCWGSTSSGKSWFQEAAGYFLLWFSSSPSEYDKAAAVPILTLSLPILVAGTTCALLLKNNGNEGSYGDIIMEGAGIKRASTVWPHVKLPWCPWPWTNHRSWQHFVHSLRQGLSCLGVRDDQMGGVISAIVFLITPLAIYVFAFIHRYWSTYKDDLSLDDRVAVIGNAVGMALTIAMSLVLIPVSRHSPLLQFMPGSWSSSPVHVILYLHHNAGRLVLIGGLVHSFLHAYRYIILLRFSLHETIIEQGNLTGLFGTMALVVLAVTTLSPIRRACYTLFWTSHVVAIPLLYIMVILHDSRVILYISGGLLYYLATTIPVWLETKSWYSNNIKEQANGVPIVAVQRIAPDGGGGGAITSTNTTDDDAATGGCIMSVTIQVDRVAMQRFRAGQYVRLVAPEISIVAHPFTINICPLSLRRSQHAAGQDDAMTSTNETADTNNMQIIFRATGNYTRQLAQRLLVGMNTSNATTLFPGERQPLPVVLRLDGFYGPSNRLRTALLEHDVILIVAGGIGITPYLSLLHQLHQNLVASFRHDKDEQQQHSLILQGAAAAKSRPTRIVLHWMCRDAPLIDYIKREYFAPLLDDRATSSNDSEDNDFGIQLVIHQTGVSSARRATTTTTVFGDRDITRNAQDDDGDQNRTREQAVQQQESVIAERPVVGVPFRPSKFAGGTKTSYLANVPLFLSFCLIGWIGLLIIWHCYTNLVSSKHHRGVLSRSFGMVCVLTWSITIAAVLNCLFSPAWEDRQEDVSFCSAISTTLNDVDETYNMEETTATSSLQGELAKRYCYTALHQTEPEGVQEENYNTSSIGVLLQRALDDTSFGDGSSSRSAPLVTLEEQCGRPNVGEFLHVFDSSSRANYPAVYVCGPNDLTQSLRLAIKEKYGRMGCFCKVALYQERFEM